MLYKRSHDKMEKIKYVQNGEISVIPHIHRNIAGLRVSFCSDPFKADQVCDWHSTYVFIERSFTRVLLCDLSKNPSQLTFTCVDSNPSKVTWDHYLLMLNRYLVDYYHPQIFGRLLYLQWSSHDTLLCYVCFTPITKYHQIPLEFPRLVHHFSERSFFFNWKECLEVELLVLTIFNKIHKKI